MSDDSLIDSNEQDKRKRMALSVAGTLAAMQLIMLFTFRSYLDFGHILTLIAFMVVVMMVFWSLRKARIIGSIIGILLATGLLYASLVKIKWNESYLQDLTTANAFILEDYIDEYPSLEGHFFSRTLGKKDWIRFAEQCVTPALAQRPVIGACRDAKVIENVYRIDIQAEIDSFLRRMQRTAQEVQEERLRTGNQYQQCIAEKRCAPIPLLPDNVDADKLVNDSTQHLAVRQAFWDLVEARGLTQSVCNAMVLCRAMVHTGVLNFGGNRAASVPAGQ